MNRFIFILFCILLSSPFAFSQSGDFVQDYIDKGEKAFSSGNYSEAANNFTAALSGMRTKKINENSAEYLRISRKEVQSKECAKIKSAADQLYTNAKSKQDLTITKTRYEEILKYNDQDRNVRQKIAECNQKIAVIDRNEADNGLWQKTTKENTVTAYENYLDKYPNGLHSENAQTNIQKLQLEASNKADNDSWQAALSENTIQAYEKYLNNYPKGINTQKAEENINNIRLIAKNEEDEKLWKQTLSYNTIEAYNSYIAESRTGKHIPDARTKIAEIRDVALWNEAKELDSHDSYKNYLNNEDNKIKKFEKEARLAVLDLTIIQEYENGNYSTALECIEVLQKSRNLTKREQEIQNVCNENIDYLAIKNNPTEINTTAFLRKYPNSEYKDEIYKKYNELKYGTEVADRQNEKSSTTRAPLPSIRRRYKPGDVWSLVIGGEFERFDVVTGYGPFLGLKVGSIENVVNFTVGGGYKRLEKTREEEIRVDGITLDQINGAAYLKVNIGRKFARTKLNIGIGGEYGYTFNSYYYLQDENIKVKDKSLTNMNSVYGVASIGVGGKHVDFKIYYKYDILSPYNANYIIGNRDLKSHENFMKQIDNKHRIGISLLCYLN